MKRQKVEENSPLTDANESAVVARNFLNCSRASILWMGGGPSLISQVGDSPAVRPRRSCPPAGMLFWKTPQTTAYFPRVHQEVLRAEGRVPVARTVANLARVYRVGHTRYGKEPPNAARLQVRPPNEGSQEYPLFFLRMPNIFDQR